MLQPAFQNTGHRQPPPDGSAGVDIKTAACCFTAQAAPTATSPAGPDSSCPSCNHSPQPRTAARRARQSFRRGPCWSKAGR